MNVALAISVEVAANFHSGETNLVLLDKINNIVS